MSKYFSKRDVYFIIVLLLLFSIWIYKLNTRNTSSKAVILIEFNGNQYASVLLEKDKTIDIPCKSGNMEVEIKNKKVRIKKSSCPNLICVKSGWINKTGDALICLPNKVIVKIIGEQIEIDAKSY